MQAAAHLFIKKALRHQKVCPGVTERIYNVLLLIADGYSTSKHIYYATNHLNITGKGWEDVYSILGELEEKQLINYHKGILKPYRGRTLGVLSCTAAGYAFISLVQDRTLKMAEKKVNEADVKSIHRAA